MCIGFCLSLNPVATMAPETRKDYFVSHINAKLFYIINVLLALMILNVTSTEVYSSFPQAIVAMTIKENIIPFSEYPS